MQILRRGLIAGLTCITSIRGAEAPLLPPHPTLLYAEYKGESLPVVAAVGNRPVVVIRGIRETLPEGTSLLTERATRYAPATAKIAGGITQRKPIVLKRLDGTQARGEQHESALTLTSSHDLPDCYLLMIAFDKDSLADPTVPAHGQIHIREIGALKAGEPSNFQLRSEIVFPTRYTDQPQALAPLIEMAGFWQLFSGGNEVRVNLPAVAAEFFYSRERALHRTAVAAWQKENRRGNRAAQPLLQIPPLLATADDLPRPASATLHLDANGVVVYAVLDQPFPDAAGTILSTTLRAWLFLPAIKDGVPTATRVRVPLKF